LFFCKIAGFLEEVKDVGEWMDTSKLAVRLTNQIYSLVPIEKT